MFTSAGRVTLEGGTHFFHINTLARLTGTTLGGECHEMPRLRICIKEMKINSAKPPVMNDRGKYLHI